MKILVASDFYAEYELYETNDPEDLKEVVKRLATGEDADTSKHTVLGYQDTMDTQEAIAQADEVVFISDLIDD